MIRSSSRVYEADDTYFGLETPDWTNVCQHAGDILNFMQHWMYTQSYLYVFLCLRLAFLGTDVTMAQQEIQAEQKSRENTLNKLNGCIYFLLLLALIMELFISSDNMVVLEIVYAFFSVVMTVIMVFSVRRVVRYLGYLKQRGVRPATKTIAVQIIALILIALFNLMAFFSSLAFTKECDAEQVRASTAGILTRSLSVAVLILWRVVTFTMLIIFLRQARPLLPIEQQSITRDLKRAFAEEEGNAYYVEQSSDDEDEEEYDDEQSSGSENDSSNMTLNRQ